MKRSEFAAQKRQARSILYAQLIGDLVFGLIFAAGGCYRELILLLVFHIPCALILYRLSIRADSRLKTPAILLANLFLFLLSLLLGEEAQIQLLFLSNFFCQVLHMRPRRWWEWAAILTGPLAWNILEWQNYDLFVHDQPAWVIRFVRLGVVNSSFLYFYLIFDFLRLRYMEIQNDVVAAGTQLQQAKNMLERQQTGLVQYSRMQVVGEMAAGIAHEINNPLSIIEAQHYALKLKLQRNALTPEDMFGTLQNLEQTTGRIAQIIQSLLYIAGNPNREPLEEVPVKTLLDSIEVLCLKRYQHHGVRLDIQKDGTEQLQIPCQRSQMAQVLLNLLANAFDAVANAPERWVRLWTVHDAEKVLFMVSDSGPGFTQQQKERLFQPFSSTKPIGKGLGLGLSVARSIVEQHQGHLWLDTAAHHTTFKVELPRVSEVPRQP